MCIYIYIYKHIPSGQANVRKWCPDCQKGSARTSPHRSKHNKTYKRNSAGEVIVAETGQAKSGWATFNLDYMVTGDDSENEAGASMASTLASYAYNRKHTKREEEIQQKGGISHSKKQGRTLLTRGQGHPWGRPPVTWKPTEPWSSQPHRLPTTCIPCA